MKKVLSPRPAPVPLTCPSTRPGVHVDRRVASLPRQGHHAHFQLASGLGAHGNRLGALSYPRSPESTCVKTLRERAPSVGPGVEQMGVSWGRSRGQKAQEVREIEATQASLLWVSPARLVSQWAAGAPEGRCGESRPALCQGWASDGTSLGDTDRTAGPLPHFWPPAPR